MAEILNAPFKYCNGLEKLDEKVFTFTEGPNSLSSEKVKLEFDSYNLDFSNLKEKSSQIKFEKFNAFIEKEQLKKFGNIYRFGPNRLKFLAPASLTIPYECPVDFEQENLIQVLYYHEGTKSWRPTKKISQDLENKTITVEVEHFTDYTPGMGSYKVDESGTLSGLPIIASVDPYFGGLSMSRNDVSVSARGIGLSVSSKFSSDLVYNIILGDDGSPTSDSTGSPISTTANSHYRFAKGWNWQLPYVSPGEENFAITLPSGRKYNLPVDPGSGASTWYGAGYYDCTVITAGVHMHIDIRLPEEKAVIHYEVTMTEHYIDSPPGDGYYDYWWDTTADTVVLYFSDGKYATFDSSGKIATLSDPTNKNTLTYTWSGSDPTYQLDRIAHTDGRAIKFYYYSISSKRVFVSMVSSDNTSNGILRAGDKFIGRYSLSSTTAANSWLDKYEALDSTAFAEDTSFTATKIQTSESTYFSALQEVAYSNTFNTTPAGDTFTITNDSGEATIVYTFREICYREDSWSYIDDNYEPPHYESGISRMNKPAVENVVTKASSSVATWKQIDYDYSFYCSGEGYIEEYTTQHHTYHPYSTTITTMEKGSSAPTSTNKTKTVIFHDQSTTTYKGTSQTKNYVWNGSDWIFLNKTANVNTASANVTDYYEVTKTRFFVSDDSVTGGTEKYSDNMDYDSYGHVKRSYKVEGSAGTPQYTWYQHVAFWTGESDPYSKFGTAPFSNPYAGTSGATYASRFSTYKCMGLAGAIRKMNDDDPDNDSCTFNDYDSSLNLVHIQVVDRTTLNTEEIFDSSLGYSDGVRYPTTAYAYDGTTNNLISITRPLGNILSIIYGTSPSWKSSFVVKDDQQMTNNLDSEDHEHIINSFDYDILGRLVKKESYMTQADGETEYSSDYPKNTIQYTYDGEGRMLTKSSIVDSVETFLIKNTYDDSNRRLTTTDSLGFRNIIQYDQLYRPTSVYKWKPNIENAGIDWEDSQGGVTAYLIGISETDYEPVFNKPIANRVFNEATGASPSSYETNHYGLTRNVYDNLGRVVDSYYTNIIDGNGTERHISNSYYKDDENYVINKSYEDATNYIQTKQISDWLGRGAKTTHCWTDKNATGDELITTNVYDYSGRLISFQQPNGTNNVGEFVSYMFSSAGSLEKVVYSDGTTLINNFNKNGSNVANTNRRGILTTYEYNDRDGVEKQITHGTPDIEIVQKYCQFGIATSEEKEGLTSIVLNSSKYNNFGSVTEFAQTIDDKTMRVQKAYSADGTILSITVIGSGASPWTKTLYLNSQWHPNPDVYNYNFSILSANSDGSSPIFKNVLGFDGSLNYIEYGSGTTISFDYDEFARLSSINNSDANISDMTFVKNFLGNIITRDDNLGSENNYAYDGMNRLYSESLGSKTYDYDKVSNLLTVGTKTWTYELLDSDTKNSIYKNQKRLRNFQDSFNSTNWDITYDNEGNVFKVSDRFNKMSHDGLNRLREIEYIGGNKDKYSYNISGLRIKKEEYARSGNAQTIYYLYSGDQILLKETYEDSTLIESVFNLLTGKATMGAFIKTYDPPSEELKYFYVDNLFSRKNITDSSGNIENSFTYDTWGELTSGDSGKARFTDKELDKSGLYYFNARYYDPIIHRFLTEDKVGSSYNYCLNDPVNLMDFDGKAPGDEFKTPQAAVRDAMSIALITGLSGNFETTGDIFYNKETNRYFSTPIVEQGPTFCVAGVSAWTWSEEWTDRGCSKNYEYIGTWHTHPDHSLAIEDGNGRMWLKRSSDPFNCDFYCHFSISDIIGKVDLGDKTLNGFIAGMHWDYSSSGSKHYWSNLGIPIRSDPIYGALFLNWMAGPDGIIYECEINEHELGLTPARGPTAAYNFLDLLYEGYLFEIGQGSMTRKDYESLRAMMENIWSKNIGMINIDWESMDLRESNPMDNPSEWGHGGNNGGSPKVPNCIPQ